MKNNLNFHRMVRNLRLQKQKEELLKEMDAYLDTSPATSIYSGSIFHQQIKALINTRSK